MDKVAAAITKKQVGEGAQYYGKRNAKAHKGHDIGTVIYRCFAGALNLATGLYEGYHVFESAPKGEGESFDFAEILGKKESK